MADVRWEMLVKKDKQKSFLSFKRYGQVAVFHPQFVQVAREMISEKDKRVVWTAGLARENMHCPACGWPLLSGDRTQDSYVQHGLWRGEDAYAVFAVYGCSDCRRYVFVPHAVILTMKRAQLQVAL